MRALPRHSAHCSLRGGCSSGRQPACELEGFAAEPVTPGAAAATGQQQPRLNSRVDQSAGACCAHSKRDASWDRGGRTGDWAHQAAANTAHWARQPSGKSPPAAQAGGAALHPTGRTATPFSAASGRRLPRLTRFHRLPNGRRESPGTRHGKAPAFMTISRGVVVLTMRPAPHSPSPYATAT